MRPTFAAAVMAGRRLGRCGRWRAQREQTAALWRTPCHAGSYRTNGKGARLTGWRPIRCHRVLDTGHRCGGLVRYPVLQYRIQAPGAGSLKSKVYKVVRIKTNKT